MSYNRASGNGINGLVVHKTDRARVVGNVLWDNGQTPKSAPESRQQYAGNWILINCLMLVALAEKIPTAIWKVIS